MQAGAAVQQPVLGQAHPALGQRAQAPAWEGSSDEESQANDAKDSNSSSSSSEDYWLCSSWMLLVCFCKVDEQNGEMIRNTGKAEWGGGSCWTHWVFMHDSRYF